MNSKEKKIDKLKITIDNANDMVEYFRGELSGDVNGQAAAWNVIFIWCQQNGMSHIINWKTGIEKVVSFLEKLKIGK